MIKQIADSTMFSSPLWKGSCNRPYVRSQHYHDSFLEEYSRPSKNLNLQKLLDLVKKSQALKNLDRQKNPSRQKCLDMVKSFSTRKNFVILSLVSFRIYSQSVI